MRQINIVFDGSDIETGLKVSELIDCLNNSSEGAVFGAWNALGDLLEEKYSDRMGIDSRNGYEAQIIAILEILQGIVETKLPLMNQEEGDADD